jgi:hypothetical protein
MKEVALDRLVRAFPLLPGKRAAFDSFVAEVKRRRDETAQFYASYGIARETWHVQQSVVGDIIICCTDIEKLQPAAAKYAASRAPYEAWFKKQVLEICGVDANTQPLGPECTMVFDSTAP